MHDLQRFIDESAQIPSPLNEQTGSTTINPGHTSWIRQDKLILMALLGVISTSVQPIVQRAATTLETWSVLAATYGKPTRGHIKQLKDQLKKSTKGTRSIDDYLQLMKSKAYQLAILEKPMDHEDFIEHILDGLPEEYRAIIDSVNNRDSLISFEELHEKLLNREAALICNYVPPETFPATANVASYKPRNNWRPNPRYNNNDQRSSRLYLGRCQACEIQGHNVKKCHLFKLIEAQAQQPAPKSWQPRANIASRETNTPSWLLDSGASHHIISDLNNLALIHIMAAMMSSLGMDPLLTSHIPVPHLLTLTLANLISIMCYVFQQWLKT